MNCTLRACTCAAIGTTYLSGIPLDYCGAHERIARALPPLRERTATKCANSACEFAPVKTGIFCNTCRKRYHAWGVTQYPKESAVSEAVVPPADGEVAAHLSAIAKIEQDLRTRRDAVAARLEAMGAAMYGYTYEIVYTVGFVRVTLPLNDKGIPVEDYARMVDAAERVLAGLEAAKAEPAPAEPEAGPDAFGILTERLTGDAWRPVHKSVIRAGDRLRRRKDGVVISEYIAPWKVRVKIGLVYDLPSISDVQKFIRQGRVVPATDQISTDGGTTWELVADFLREHGGWSDLAPHVGPARIVAGAAPLPKDDDIWPPPAVMAAARAWAVATGEEADRLGRQIRSLCGSDMEVIAIKATACAEIADLERTEALADRDRARMERDEAERDAVAERAAREEAAEGAAKLLDRLNTAEGKLLAIADLLNEDEERSPSFDADDKPIPLVDRVRVALMPDGFGKSEWERRVTKILDQYGAPVAFGSEVPASPYGRVALVAKLLKEERERAKEQAEEICAALRVLSILGVAGGEMRPLRDVLMQALPESDRRAVLEVEAAEARAALARVKARRVDPATPQELAEYEARAAAAQAALNELPAGEEG